MEIVHNRPTAPRRPELGDLKVLAEIICVWDFSVFLLGYADSMPTRLGIDSQQLLAFVAECLLR